MIDPNSDDSAIILGDCSVVLEQLPSNAFQLIYIDPPFNTGTTQRRRTMSATQSDSGERIGFAGKSYDVIEGDERSYADTYDDYLGFLAPLLSAARDLLSDDGTLYVHLDYREAHYAKVLLDELYGRDAFINEIIWAYDYGGRSKSRWPAKHDTILMYAKNPDSRYFDVEAVDRIPYMAPGLVGKEKAARGKSPTDVWWHTIVGTSAKEKTGYPTQKPEGILRRVIQASSEPGAMVLDFFAGSGTTAAVAQSLGRRFVAVDSNPQAVEVMRARLGPDVRLIDASSTTPQIPRSQQD